ncbi:hypothetical protein [Mycolicibacterium confluentis]|uniref:hypothetical protein n=1 Tax=Mycolicibacterium confluentis TaxID=28047 RepID=UPI000A155521|nr:hypothetical protein [Mycolicibacterium confluentis]MCV7319239.1 hypothetical protein [Mycolicibacterium confluentis]ORV24944.1 hypothetical protein AWB99_05550 [Mycolicibacterium confluentis]
MSTPESEPDFSRAASLFAIRLDISESARRVGRAVDRFAEAGTESSSDFDADFSRAAALFAMRLDTPESPAAGAGPAVNSLFALLRVRSAVEPEASPPRCADGADAESPSVSAQATPAPRVSAAPTPKVTAPAPNQA